MCQKFVKKVSNICQKIVRKKYRFHTEFAFPFCLVSLAFFSVLLLFLFLFPFLSVACVEFCRSNQIWSNGHYTKFRQNHSNLKIHNFHIYDFSNAVLQVRFSTGAGPVSGHGRFDGRVVYTAHFPASIGYPLRPADFSNLIFDKFGNLEAHWTGVGKDEIIFSNFFNFRKIF